MPKHINVLGQKIRICYNDSALKKDELGLFDSTSMTIHILQCLKEHPLHNSVLVHEIIHAALCISGNSQMLDKGVEEAICMSLEFALKPFIKDVLL